MNIRESGCTFTILLVNSKSCWTSRRVDFQHFVTKRPLVFEIQLMYKMRLIHLQWCGWIDTVTHWQWHTCTWVRWIGTLHRLLNVLLYRQHCRKHCRQHCTHLWDRSISRQTAHSTQRNIVHLHYNRDEWILRRFNTELFSPQQRNRMSDCTIVCATLVWLLCCTLSWHSFADLLQLWLLTV